VPNPSAEEIARTYLAHRVFEAGVLAELVRQRDAKFLDRLEAHLRQERAAVERADRAASVRLSGEFHLKLVDALNNLELSRFLRELLARSALMVSAFEPASLSLCGVDEHAAIAAALRAGDAERAIALSGDHFRHIEERLARGLVERSETSIEDALASLAQASGPPPKRKQFRQPRRLATSRGRP
jgi:DNA-binding GntR family transcriptional regulator